MIKRLQYYLDEELRSYIVSHFNSYPLVCHFYAIRNSRYMQNIQEKNYDSTYDFFKGNRDMLYIK